MVKWISEHVIFSFVDCHNAHCVLWSPLLF